MRTRDQNSTHKPPKRTLDRDAWLKKALDILFSHGVAEVKIEVLARKLKLTKGSFYWHFKNRDDLFHSMVDWWRNNQLKFITGLDPQAINPIHIIKSVIDFTQRTDDASHDIAMREFARFNKYAARAVAEVDEQRTQYLAELFRAADFTETDALLRARVLYFYQVGEYTTLLSIDSTLRDDLAERQFALLTRPP